MLKFLLMFQHFSLLLYGACEKFISQRRGQAFVFFPNIRPRIKSLVKAMIPIVLGVFTIFLCRHGKMWRFSRFQIFYHDGTNSGYFRDGVHSDNPERYGKEPIEYMGDMELMKEAERNVMGNFKAEDFNPFTHNSIDYAKAVCDECERLKKERSLEEDACGRCTVRWHLQQ
jgi:hypothetical protein